MSTTQNSHVYAVVEDATITNVVVATADFARALPGAVRIDQLNPRPGVGWRFTNRRWTPPPEVSLHPVELFGAGPHAFPQ